MWAGHITSLLNCWGPATHTPGARRWHRWAGQSVSIHIDDQHWQKNSSWDSTVHIFVQNNFSVPVIASSGQHQLGTCWISRFFQEKDHVLVPFVQIADLRSRRDAQKNPLDVLPWNLRSVEWIELVDPIKPGVWRLSWYFLALFNTSGDFPFCKLVPHVSSRILL